MSDSELITDALDDRLIPSEGKLDALKFESLFDTDIPFSIEVRSKHLREKFPDYEERARYVLRSNISGS